MEKCMSALYYRRNNSGDKAAVLYSVCKPAMDIEDRDYCHMYQKLKSVILFS